MATLRWLFICFCWFSSINSEILEENASNTSESYSSEINAVLNYLNSSPFKVYNYKKATLLNAQIKADIIELILDINVDCINKYPDVPCGEKIVTCNAFVTKNTPQEESKVLTDVNCKPKPEIIIEEQVYDSSPDSTEVYYNQPKPIALSNEAVSSEVGEHFIAVRKDSVPCLGCPFDLNPNAEGVDELIDTALQHIETERPKKQALVKVLKLQQQVVNGVKYILTAEFASTICDKTATTNSCPRDNDVETTICEITYLHKPWISKAKHVIKNNCTVSQEFVRAGEQKSDLSNEIDVSGKHKKVSDNPNFDNMAETGAIDEMTPSRLADLEAQIVVETETELASTIETRPQVEAKIEVSEEPVMTTEDDLLRLKRDASSEESKSASEDSASNSKEDSSEEKRRPKRAIRQLEKISPDEKNLVKNLADFAANALDSIDDDNNKRIILQILGAKKMVGDDGVYYHIIMRMGVSRCLEDGPVNPYENCKDKLFENYTKICKVQVFVNDDFGSKKVVKSQCQNIKRDKNDNNRTNYSRFRRDVLVGGPNRIDKNSEKIRQYLNEGIKGFNANSKENNKFKPVEVISATRQVVAGTLHKITTKISESDCSQNDAKDLDDCNILQGASPKICEIKVWDKPWENFRQFTIKCEGDDRKIKFQTTPKRSKRQIPGGETQVDKESETVKKYVREGLLNLNTRLTTSNKVKPVEVVSATSQVVSGSLHRIKVKISESDCSRNDQKDFEQCNVLEGASPKLCEMEVWDKPWQKFRRYTIKCEGENKEHQFDLTTKRKKRDVAPGGESPVAKDNEFVVKYLEAALNQLDSESSHENKFKVHEVISATSQTVSGHIYRIKAKVVLSDCKKSVTTERGQCGTLKDSQPKTCKFEVFEQVWVPNSRTIKTKCDEDRSKRQAILEKTSKRLKRQIPGGETQVDKESETVKKYVREGLLNLNTRLTTSNKVKPVEVVSATSQVVSGSLHRIKVKISESDCSRNDQKDFEQCNILEGASPKLCEIEVWDKPWEKFRRYTIKCEGEIKEHQFDLTTKRKKRDLAPGGESPVAKDNEFVVKYLEAALNQLDSESSHENKFKVHEVISATSQTVSGHIYRIKAKVVLSDCKKSVTTERGQCGTLKDAQPKTCKFEVFEQVWVPNSRTIKTKCDQDRTKRQSIPGGTVEVDKTSDKVKEYVRDSVIHLNTQLSSSNKVKPVEVLSANSQVVSGVVYRIKVKISESDCAKNDEKHFEECNIREGATPKICEVRVWDKPWQNFRQFNITCEGEEREFSFEQKTKNKRQVGSNTLDLDDPKYQRSLFHDFIQKFNKDYTKKEYKYRFHVFVENLFRIRLLNTYEQGTATYGVTRFADLTHDEFSESLGLRKNLKNENELPVPEAKIPNIELPVEFDWRKKGAVTEVKNQGECGSCWAFSVTGNVEGQYFIQHGKLVELSEQELVDCDKSDNGCEGGDMNSAYRAIEKLGGLEAEKDYPYEGEDETCHFNRSLARVQVTGAVNISHNETDMAKWLVANGPISIAINANAMQFYLGGVSHPFKFLCSPNNLDHGVLVVGYGVHYYPLFKKRLPYWIVKNSWGASWGEQGYYRVYRGDGTCGLNQEPTSAIVA